MSDMAIGYVCLENEGPNSRICGILWSKEHARLGPLPDIIEKVERDICANAEVPLRASHVWFRITGYEFPLEAEHAPGGYHDEDGCYHGTMTAMADPGGWTFRFADEQDMVRINQALRALEMEK